MADTKTPPAPDHPWRNTPIQWQPLRRDCDTWSEDWRMELEAFVEKRS